jgi:glutamine amidotransferase-like uncharacterized protein
MAFATIYEQYAAANKRLAKGEKLFFPESENQWQITDRKTSDSRRLRCPNIGVYTGQGTSHSWLWFVDLFDRMGFHNLSFLNETTLQDSGLVGLDVLAISGGDTFTIAGALGKVGAKAIKRFIENGGLYIGSCAGAYLPMNSSKSPLNLFNFANVKISNLTKTLPDCQQLRYKFSTAYGCCFVFHPVREVIGLHFNGTFPIAGAGRLTAPLYGGPGMIATDGAQILAHYETFTDKTVFLVDEALAAEALIGKAAAVRANLGRGFLYLFGPHLEHPHFPEANRVVADTIFWETSRIHANASATRTQSEILSDSVSRHLILELKRELSNARIVAAGLEMLPIRWLIGTKYYEPEKIRVFLESMWRRLKSLESHGRLYTYNWAPTDLSDWVKEITRLLRLMKNELDHNRDTLHVAGRLFALLQKTTAAYLQMYFLTVSESS